MQVLKKPGNRRDTQGGTRWLPGAGTLNHRGKTEEGVEGRTGRRGSGGTVNAASSFSSGDGGTLANDMS